MWKPEQFVQNMAAERKLTVVEVFQFEPKW